MVYSWLEGLSTDLLDQGLTIYALATRKVGRLAG